MLCVCVPGFHMDVLMLVTADEEQRLWHLNTWFEILHLEHTSCVMCDDAGQVA